MGAAAEVVAHHSVVGEDRQHRLLQFDLRQKLGMADIPSVGVSPERLHCDIGDLHFAPSGPQGELSASLHVGGASAVIEQFEDPQPVQQLIDLS